VGGESLKGETSGSAKGKSLLCFGGRLEGGGSGVCVGESNQGGRVRIFQSWLGTLLSCVSGGGGLTD